MEFIREYKNQITAIASVLLLILGYNLANESKIAEAQRKENATKTEARIQQLKYDLCVDSADTAYWKYMELNGTKNAKGEIWAQNSTWDRANSDKKASVDLCYRQYKQ